MTQALIEFQTVASAIQYLLDYYDDPRMGKVANHARAIEYLRKRLSDIYTLEQAASKSGEAAGSEKPLALSTNGNHTYNSQPPSEIQTWGSYCPPPKVYVGRMEYNQDAPVSA